MKGISLTPTTPVQIKQMAPIICEVTPKAISIVIPDKLAACHAVASRLGLGSWVAAADWMDGWMEERGVWLVRLVRVMILCLLWCLRRHCAWVLGVAAMIFFSRQLSRASISYIISAPRQLFSRSSSSCSQPCDPVFCGEQEAHPQLL